MKYLIIDGMLNGTGIRDEYEGGYLDPSSVGLSDTLRLRLNGWLKRYNEQHFLGYSMRRIVEELDLEGLSLAEAVREELTDVKVSYYSDAYLWKRQIP